MKIPISGILLRHSALMEKPYILPLTDLEAMAVRIYTRPPDWLTGTLAMLKIWGRKSILLATRCFLCRWLLGNSSSHRTDILDMGSWIFLWRKTRTEHRKSKISEKTSIPPRMILEYSSPIILKRDF